MGDEERIASIIGEWVEARNRGERRDPEEVARANPDLADELLRRFSVLVGMEHALRTDGDAVLRTLPLDRYRDYRPVGHGGMGIVYWALDTDLNREVALKIVRPRGSGGDESRTPDDPIGVTPPGRDTPASKAFETLKARFLQEAWVTGGMAHPGIVPVYELGQTPDGIPYYTMRFVKGSRTLASAIEEVRDRSMEDRLTLLEPFLKVCDTMSYAHAHGVIHRDLKPENVALGEFGEVVVLDWGLAKTRDGPDSAENLWQERIREYREATDLRTLAGALGTPGYMSPEAALGGAAEVDERSDVYSLGTVLFELLTGRLPFPFESFIELVRRLKDEDAPRPSDVNPQVPVGLSDLCAQALSRDPAGRPASAEVLAREIRAWQARRAEDLEIAGLLREARGALEGAAGLRGEDVVRLLDRAGAACSQVMQTRPGDADAAAIQQEVGRLRERGIEEREKTARGRLLRRGGVVVLIIATIVTGVFATVLESRRRRAEDAERVAARERDEKDAAFRRAEGLRLAAESRAVLETDAGLALALAVQAGKLHRSPLVVNALTGAVRRHRGRWTLPGRGSSIQFSPDSRHLVARDRRDCWVIDLETREVAARLVDQRPAGFSADGSLMATAHGSGVSVWDTRTWQPVIDIDTGESFPEAGLSPDGTRLFTRTETNGRELTLWDVRTGRRHRTLEGHTGEIQDAKFSDDGTRLLTVSQDDRTTRVWDVAAGVPLLVIRGDDDDLEEVGPGGERDTTALASAYFTTDGSRIVTLSANGAIRVWDAETGEQGEKLEDVSPYVYPLQRAKDRDRFQINTIARGAAVILWEPTTGRRNSIRPPAGFEGTSLDTAISADGELLLHVWAQDRVIRVLDADTGEEVRTLPGDGVARFSPDGRWIATASRNEGALCLWDSRSREDSLTLDLTHRGGIGSARLSEDGRRITTFGQSDRTALVRDVETGRTLPAHSISDGSWGESSPDGSVAILWPGRQQGRLAEVSTGRTLTDFERPLGLEALAYSRDARLFAGQLELHRVGYDELIRVVETATGRVVADIPGEATSATFDRTGSTLAFSRCDWFGGTGNAFPRRVVVYDLEAGKTRWSIDLPPGQPVEGVALDPDADRLLAWSGRDAFLFDVGAGEPRWTTSIGGSALIRWAGLSADGERVGVLVDALPLRVFDAATGDLLFTVPRAGGVSWVVRWSPRGRRLLTADRDGVARIRDGDTGEVLTVLRGHEMSLFSAEYSGDGGRIVTVSYDQAAKVWDTATGRELLSVRGHANERVSDFRILPETGNVLVVTSGRRAEVRDPKDWALVARFPEPVRSFVVSPAGSFLVSPDGALVASEWRGTVWNARTGERITHSWTDADRKRFTAMQGRSSPDGRWRLDFRNDRNGQEDADRVQVLDIATGERRTVLEGHAASVTSARFGPASRLVVTASVDRTARVWDARSGDEIMSLDHPDEVRDAAISPDGTFLVTLSEGKLRRFPMDPFAVAVSLGPRPLTVAERRRFEVGAPEKPEEAQTSLPEPGSALRLYESLLEELGDEAEVRARLASDGSLAPEARDAAEKIRLTAFDHARHLKNRAWQIAVAPGKTSDEYGEALRLALVAARLAPDDPEIVATVAKAMIRTGSEREGVATLERVSPVRAEAAGHGIPTDAAFLALGYHFLGRAEEARTALAKCREFMKHPGYATDTSRAVLVPLLREVAALLE